MRRFGAVDPSSTAETGATNLSLRHTERITSSVFAAPAPAPPSEAAEDTEIFAVLETVDEGTRLVLGQPSFVHGRADSGCGVLELQLPDCVVELTSPSRGSQPVGILLGEAAGLDHLVETLDEPCACLEPRMALSPMGHAAPS